MGADSEGRANFDDRVKVAGQPDPIITHSSALVALIERLVREPSIGLDTEYRSQRAAPARLSLVQIALESGETHLVDALAFKDLSPLGAVLASTSVTKILHGACNDLPVLRAAIGRDVRNIYDTQVAASLVGWERQISLAKLVHSVCNVRLSKQSQASNWLRRPLSSRQLAYARTDVIHLHRLREAIEARASALGRAEWIREEMSRLDKPREIPPPDPVMSILARPRTARLNPPQRAILAALAQWRHDHAPTPSYSDRDLFRLTMQSPRSARAVRRVVPRSAEDAAALARVIAEARQTPVDQCPPPFGAPDRDEVLGMHLLQLVVRTRAKEHDLSPDVVATSRHLRHLVRRPDDPSNPVLRGWRRQVAGNDLLAVLDGQAMLRFRDGSVTIQTDA